MKPTFSLAKKHNFPSGFCSSTGAALRHAASQDLPHRRRAVARTGLLLPSDPNNAPSGPAGSGDFKGMGIDGDWGNILV